MATFELQQSPIASFRRPSLDVPKAVIKPASSALRRFSLSAQHSPKPQKTVAFDCSVKAHNSRPQRSILYHLHTSYLFVASDIKTILVPQTLFGLINAYSSTKKLTNSETTLSSVLAHAPLVILWILLNLLPFCIGNQRQPNALAEDKTNKPWRPLAAKRCTPEESRTWMLALYAVAFVASLCMGGTSMCVVLMVLGWLYNDCHLSEKGWLEKNILTALGYVAFGIGAMMVAIPNFDTHMIIDAQTWQWTILLAGVIGTTSHLTDLPDLEGDRLAGRKTAPIVMGESVAAWTIAIPVAVWSLLCPWFWEARYLGFVLPVVLGKEMISKLLTKNTVLAHKHTCRVWNLWIAVLYLLPLLSIKS